MSYPLTLLMAFPNCTHYQSDIRHMSDAFENATWITIALISIHEKRYCIMYRINTYYFTLYK